MELKPKVLNTLEQFTAICRSGVHTELLKKMKSENIEDVKVDNIKVNAGGQIECSVSIRPKMPVQMITLSFTIGDMFLQDGLMRLPDGSGLYERKG